MRATTGKKEKKKKKRRVCKSSAATARRLFQRHFQTFRLNGMHITKQSTKHLQEKGKQKLKTFAKNVCQTPDTEWFHRNLHEKEKLPRRSQIVWTNRDKDPSSGRWIALIIDSVSPFSFFFFPPFLLLKIRNAAWQGFLLFLPFHLSQQRSVSPHWSSF